MNRYRGLCLLAGVLFWTGNAGAVEVNLEVGESYRQGDLAITCGNASGGEPLALAACQYWDEFNHKCLFEKTTYAFRNLECVEECQHWDKFNSTCLYRTKCVFSPPHKSFVRTTCEKFDNFNHLCVQTREMKIGGRP